MNDRKDWDDTVSELKEDDGACWRERMKKMCERVLKDAWPGWTMGGESTKNFPQGREPAPIPNLLFHP